MTVFAQGTKGVVAEVKKNMGLKALSQTKDALKILNNGIKIIETIQIWDESLSELDIKLPNCQDR